MDLSGVGAATFAINVNPACNFKVYPESRERGETCVGSDGLRSQREREREPTEKDIFSALARRLFNIGITGTLHTSCAPPAMHFAGITQSDPPDEGVNFSIYRVKFFRCIAEEYSLNSGPESPRQDITI